MLENGWTPRMRKKRCVHGVKLNCIPRVHGTFVATHLQVWSTRLVCVNFSSVGRWTEGCVCCSLECSCVGVGPVATSVVSSADPIFDPVTPGQKAPEQKPNAATRTDFADPCRQPGLDTHLSARGRFRRPYSPLYTLHHSFVLLHGDVFLLSCRNCQKSLMGSSAAAGHFVGSLPSSRQEVIVGCVA